MKYTIILKHSGEFMVDHYAADTIDGFVHQMIESGFVVAGFRSNFTQRPELQGQPTFRGLYGPMWNGNGIRYECAEVYEGLSA